MIINSPRAWRPAGAYDDLRAEVLPDREGHRLWEPSDGPLPATFVSHGIPVTLDDPAWLRDLYNWARSMPKPRAIVVVSAHWENAPAAISGAAAGTPLHYDYFGVHPRYFELTYQPRTPPRWPDRSPERSARRHQCTTSPTEVSTTARSSP